VKRLLTIFMALFVWLLSGASYGYSGALDFVICDIKRPLAGLEGRPVDQSNYKAILDGMANKLRCNGLRTYIDPSIKNKKEYTKIYKDVFGYARDRLGMVIYANPLGTGDFSKDDEEYANWIVDYAKQFKPDFIGPFNEPGMSTDRMLRISAKVKEALQDDVVMVGPDLQKVHGTIDKISKEPRLARQFDILAAHNAEQDEQATPQAWKNLSRMKGGAKIWASENPRSWSVKNPMGQEIGVQSTVESDNSVSGLILYLAYPSSINEQGELTNKGNDIVSNIGQIEDPKEHFKHYKKGSLIDKLKELCGKVVNCD
jgi:hypothetical protein